MPTDLGKAFEYACAHAIFLRNSSDLKIEYIYSEPLNTAEHYFTCSSANDQSNLMAAARAGIRVISRIEPRLYGTSPSLHIDPLYLSIMPDSAGQSGDVRDVLCVRRLDGLELGLSCKHNHRAVKHSRLSSTIDFGQKWLGVPCSKRYFDEIRPVFDELRRLQSEGRESNHPVLFDDFSDKHERFYLPVLNAFKDELLRIYENNDGVPASLVRYLMGRHDFYKVISHENRRFTEVQAVNLNGSLGRPVGGRRGAATIPQLRAPNEFLAVRLCSDSETTLEIVCNRAWTLHLRIHSASKKVEPSLKFDIQLIGYPEDYYIENEPWDI